MKDKNKNVLSVEELKALQAKVSNGEKLTSQEEDQLLAAEMEAEEASRHSTQDEEINRIASIIAKKIKSGNVEGGEPFVPASAEEVAKMKKLTPAEKAEEYFSNQKDFPWPGIFVSDDLQIFIDHVQGVNALHNHISAHEGMKAYKFDKPQ